MPNAVVKPKGGSKLYIGHEIENCRDFFGLYYLRPFEKVCSRTGLPVRAENYRITLLSLSGNFDRLGYGEGYMG